MVFPLILAGAVGGLAKAVSWAIPKVTSLFAKAPASVGGAIAETTIKVAPKVSTAVIPKVSTAVITKTPTPLLQSVFKVATLGAKTPTGKLLGGATTIATTGALIKEPVATIKAPFQLTSSLFNVGGNVATLATDPSLENAKTLFSENPLLVGSAAAVGALAVGKGALMTAAAVKTLSGSEEVTINTGESVTPTTKDGQKPLGVDAPIYPETTNVTTGKARRRRKAKKVVTPTTIRQNVLVQVSNRAVGTKTANYLKRENVLYA